MNTEIIFWLVLLIVAIIVEIFTMGLTTIWFAGGALVAVLTALIGAPIWLQAVLFFAVSLILLIFTRPIAVKYFNKERVKTNVESIVGRQAIVTSEICNLHGIGQVTVGGQEWSARSSIDKAIIPAGSVVKVVAVDGVKVVVEVDEQMGEALKAARPEPLSVSEIEEMESQNPEE